MELGGHLFLQRKIERETQIVDTTKTSCRMLTFILKSLVPLLTAPSTKENSFSLKIETGN